MSLLFTRCAVRHVTGDHTFSQITYSTVGTHTPSNSQSCSSIKQVVPKKYPNHALSNNASGSFIIPWSPAVTYTCSVKPFQSLRLTLPCRRAQEQSRIAMRINTQFLYIFSQTLAFTPLQILEFQTSYLSAYVYNPSYIIKKKIRITFSSQGNQIIRHQT